MTSSFNFISNKENKTDRHRTIFLFDLKYCGNNVHLCSNTCWLWLLYLGQAWLDRICRGIILFKSNSK